MDKERIDGSDHHSSGCSSESSSCLTEAASYGRGKGTCQKKCKKPCLACKERFCKRVAGSLFLFCDDFSWDIIGIRWKFFHRTVVTYC